MGSDAKPYFIRPAEKADCGKICSLIYELAAYQGLQNGPSTTAERLEKDGFPTDPKDQPAFECFVVVDQPTKEIFGFALFFPFYSTWKGKGIYLEDLYIQPNKRRLGIGSELLSHVAKHTLSTGGTQIRFAVRKDNEKGQKFYSKHDFEKLSDNNGWELSRFDETALKKLAEKSN